MTTGKKVAIALGAVTALSVIGYFTKEKWMPIFKGTVKPVASTLEDVAKPVGKPMSSIPANSKIVQPKPDEKHSFVASKNEIRGIRDYKSSGFIGTANLDNQPR